LLSCFGALLCCGAAFEALCAGLVLEECSVVAGRSADGFVAVLVFAGRFAVFTCDALLGRSAGVALLVFAGRFAVFTCDALFVVVFAGRFVLVVAVCVCALGGRSERVVLARLVVAVFGRFVFAVFVRFTLLAALACTTPLSLNAPGFGVAAPAGAP
jgi:hypothetical protein